MVQIFTPFELGDCTLKNRIVMPPMCLYEACHWGLVKELHRVHYGARAYGQVGLIIQEATAVEKRGRLSDRDLGIWNHDQVSGLTSLVDTVHTLGGHIAIQLGHGGRKAFVEQGQEAIAPSPLPFSPDKPIPREASEQDLYDIKEAFIEGARRSVAAGYDAVELHGAHGYLLQQFVSPYSNHRQDEYGGSLEGRLRFPLQVIRGVKEVLPPSMPLLLRISAQEYCAEGYSFQEMLTMTEHFKEAGVDLIDVSTGGAVPYVSKTWPGYQVPYAQEIKEKTGIPVITCGLLSSYDLAEEVIANGRADFIAIGRGLLANPHWALEAAASLGVRGIVPEAYTRAFPQEMP